MYVFIFYCLCFVEDISANITEKQVMEETYPDFYWEKDFSIYDDMEEHCKGFKEEENEGRGKVNYQRW